MIFWAEVLSSCRNADYTMIWNALDYVALTIPVTKVDQVLDVKKPPHKFLSNDDQKNYEFCTCIYSLQSSRHSEIFLLDDPSIFTNAPIAVQVVGRTLEEEAVIAMSKIVVAAVAGKLTANDKKD
jgi:amidase